MARRADPGLPQIDNVSLLVGGVAHDLNNTLAPILMSVDRLGFPGETRRRDLVHGIRAGARHCAALARQLLAISRGAGIPREELRLGPLVEGFAGLIGPMLGDRVRLEFEFRREPPRVRADPTQIRQALMNLCVNARDAMVAGGRILMVLDRVDFEDVRAPSAEESAQACYATVSVIDSGSGIPPAILDRIFDPYFSTKAKGHSTGLGLPTVKEIVKAHGGFLTVESRPRRGSTFRIFLPASLEPAVAARKWQVEAKRGQVFGGRPCEALRTKGGRRGPILALFQPATLSTYGSTDSPHHLPMSSPRIRPRSKFQIPSPKSHLPNHGQPEKETPPEDEQAQAP